MTWTWDATAIETSDLQGVRSRIGDTNTNDQQMSDEEINALVTAKGSVVAAAIECCKRILAKEKGEIDRNVAGTNAPRSQKHQHLRDVMKDLRHELLSGVTPKLTGHSTAEKDALAAESDYPQANVRRGQFDNG